MPSLDAQQPRRLEIQDSQDHQVWRQATLEGITADGRVFIRYDDKRHNRLHLDLTKFSYRWIHEPAPAVGNDGPSVAVPLPL